MSFGGGSTIGGGGFQIGTGAAAPQTQFSFGTPAASAAVTQPLFNFLSQPSSSITAGLGGISTAAAPPAQQQQPGISLNPLGSTPAGVTATGGVTLNTTTATTASNSLTLSQMNFRQLQEFVNKWTVELEEHEKSFIEQATKVNSWDKTLMVNGDKITKLNETVEKVKSDHLKLEHTLDYLKIQQQEFEAFLDPLEASLPVNITPEPDREHLYNIAETMHTQLQQMAEDLKEVIRHINDTNKPIDKTDPVSQILKILNEHTDALQWVEDNSNAVKKSLEDVTKMHQMFRRDHERSLRLMYKN